MGKTNSLEDIILQLNEQFNKKVGEKIPGAVILFIRDGEIYYTQAFGYKDLANREIMTADSIFQVASLSKSICALGTMKLVEDGIITLDEPVEKYLTRWQLPSSKYQTKDVTFGRLLNHTAGISVQGFLGYSPKNGLPTIEQSLLGNTSTIYRMTPVRIKNEPGKKWDYSGGGYTILQLAMEEITGKRFSEYMYENVFQKMNMNNSFYTFNGSLESKLAKPYNNFLFQIPSYLYTEEAAAGLYTTVDDLAKVIIEMMKCYHSERNDLIINRSTLLLMLNSPVSINNESKWDSMGLGYFISNIGNGIRTYGHSGSNRGWRAHYEFSLDTKDGIIILTNGNRGSKNLIMPIVIEWRKHIGNK
jgi:CubicO group peptidase (beta-lactamase class C family)